METATKSIIMQACAKIGIDFVCVNLHTDFLPLDFVPQTNCGHSWWSGASKEIHNIWLIYPDGRVTIATAQSASILEAYEREPYWDGNYKFSNNGEAQEYPGITMLEYARLNPNFLGAKYMIVQREGKEYGDNGAHFDDWDLYPVPSNFLNKQIELLEKETTEKILTYEASH